MTVIINGTTGITNDGGYTGDGVVFADTTPANTLVTTTGGNVGVGTSSPGERLDVVGSARILRNTGATNTGDQNVVVVGATTTGAYASSYGAGLQFQITNSTGGYSGSRIVSRLNADNNTANLVFQARNYGFADSMTLDSSGNLLVGTTTSTPAGISQQGLITTVAPSGKNGINVATTGAGTAIQFANTAFGQTGSVSIGSSTTAYNTSSDYRLKNTIAPMTGALAKVAALKPCTYKWNADGSDGEGFIAHELAEVVPQCVTGEKDAVDAEGNPQYQGIDTSFLIATLTAAIQELKAIVDAQGAEIAALKGTQP